MKSNFYWRTVCSFLLVCLAGLGNVGSAQGQDGESADGIWGPAPAGARVGEPAISPESYRLVRLDEDAFEAKVAPARIAAARPAPGSVTISLPHPEGKYVDFEIVEAPIMAPALAAKFPEIKTYSGRAVDGSPSTVRISRSPLGFHAQILSPTGAIYIDPYVPADNEFCIVYYRRDYRKKLDHRCLLQSEGPQKLQRARKLAKAATTATRTGSQLRTYRLACAANGEYTQFHGGTAGQGMAAVVTAINRVTGIYEVELSIRLELVANNNLLIYTDPATDPYTNSNPSALLTENQNNCDAVIGNANYDVGHVFTTGGGGLAGLGVVGIDGQKAQGETGLGSPIGDPFYVDYVAHELGHQFGGNHTFNGDSGNCSGGNRNGGTAYEPGSGSTIQAYAGICSDDNLQSNSDPYFHSVSLDEMINHVDNVIPGVGVRTATGNAVPTVDAGSDFTIPARTPFGLTAIGNDANAGDTLTYSWEERDLGPQQDVNAGDNGSSPLFRFWPPTTDPSRVFPRLGDLLNNTTVIGETLPTTTRTMNFRATVRDNVGGVNTDDAVVDVIDTGAPFRVTSPNTSVTWGAGTQQTITWDVAGTNANGIDAANVDILLSNDGGLTYPFTVVANTPNDGSQAVSVPNLGADTTQARIKVQGSGNIFFDISDADFTINSTPGFTITLSPNGADLCAPGSVVYTVQVQSVLGFSNPVTLSLDSLPAGITGAFGTNPVIPGNSSTLTITSTAAPSGGTYGIGVNGNSGPTSASGGATLQLLHAPVPINLLTPGNGAVVSRAPTLTWSTDPSAVTYTVQIDDDPGFGSIDQSGVLNSTSYKVDPSLSADTRYFWRVQADNACGTITSSTGFFDTVIEFSDSPALAIPDGNASGTFTDLVIPGGSVTIADLNVGIDIAHTWVGDLELRLQHVDTGTTVTIFDRPGYTGSDFGSDGDNPNIVLDDEAAQTAEDNAGSGNPAYPIGGHFQPNNPLSAFDGESLSGTWRLTVIDHESADTGTLNSWSLIVEADAPAIPEISVEQPAGFSLTDGADTVDYGSVGIGQNSQKTFTIRNQGTANLTSLAVTKSGAQAGDFAIGALGSTTLAPGASTTFAVTFSPGGLGPRAAALDIVSNDSDENPFDIDLVGSGLGPEIVVEQPDATNLTDGVSSIDFGGSNVGQSNPLTFTIRNTGNQPLTGLAASFDGSHAGDFSAAVFGATTLNPGESTTVAVSFTPNAVGNRSAALHIASNDADENPFDIAISGEGTFPEIAILYDGSINIVDGASTINYGGVVVTESQLMSYTIENTGTGPLTGLALNIDGTHAADYSAADLLATTVAPGASTTFSITFNPSAAGTRNAAMHVSSNDADENPFDLGLTGIGLDPEIAVEEPVNTGLEDGVSARSLGSVNLGSSINRSFTIRNVGTVNLTGLAVGFSGPDADLFAAGALGATTLTPGSSTTVSVSFSPVDAGDLGGRSASMHIASNDRDENPFDIALGGTGTTPEIVVEQPVDTDLTDGVSSTDFGDVLLASNAVRTYTIRNVGTGPLSGLAVSTSGPDAADFAGSAPLLTTLNPGESTTFAVTFAPGSLGPASAALHIANDDLDENPFDLALGGTGVSPEIVVELSGVEQTDGGSTVEFDDLVGIAAVSTDLVLTIRNTGTADLTGLGTSITGASAGSFSATAIPATLQPGQSTTTTLTFSTGSTGIKSADLLITSSDLDESPFDLALLGAKLERTTLQSWAESFGLAGKELLFDSDDDGDLITLLEEYAFNLDPTVADGLIMAPGGSSGLPLIRLLGDRLQIEYLRRRSDPDLEYSAEFGSDLTEGAPDGFLPATEPESVTTVDLDFRRVIVNDSVTTATHPSRFGKVKLSYPEPP